MPSWRPTCGGPGLMEQVQGPTPEDLVEQIDLLLGPLSKEEMVAALVARACPPASANAPTSTTAAPRARRGSRRTDRASRAGPPPAAQKAVQEGRLQKDGIRKTATRRAATRRANQRLQKKPVWDDDGFATPSGDGEWTPRETAVATARASGGAKKGGYKEPSRSFEKAVANY